MAQVPEFSAYNFTSQQPRGLRNFISEIRKCASKEQERTRVDAELGNIRLKFATGGSLSSYQKKKYIWKLCYIHMLGHEVDFGHMELISLMSSSKYSEKSVGYMACSLLMGDNEELLKLVLNSMRNDLLGSSPVGVTLALSAIANLANTQLTADAFTDDVLTILDGNGLKAMKPLSNIASLNNQGGDSNNNNEMDMERFVMFARKKAALATLRLFRSSPEHIAVREWPGKIESYLSSPDMGFLTSVLSLAYDFTAAAPYEYSILVDPLIKLLHRLLVSKIGVTTDYLYYRISCPWLVVKIIKLLQLYDAPHKPEVANMLKESIHFFFEGVDQNAPLRPETANGNGATGEPQKVISEGKKNAYRAILLELISLIVKYGGGFDPALHTKAVGFLHGFIDKESDANVRYLGIDGLTKIARAFGAEIINIDTHLEHIIPNLQDSDVSIRRRTLELLYAGATQDNAMSIVTELIKNLSQSDDDIKESIVVKIAILAENFTSNITWYVETMIQVIISAGDAVSEYVVNRLIHVISNNEESHTLAASKAYEATDMKFLHDRALTLCGYILGEFGVNICEEQGRSGYEQFAKLHNHYGSCSQRTKAVLVSSYAKIMNCYPDTRAEVSRILQEVSKSSDQELQQRACEYLVLAQTQNVSLMENVLQEMPEFPERQNTLESQIALSKQTDALDGSNVSTSEKKTSMTATRSFDSGASGSSNGDGDLLSMDDNGASMNGSVMSYDPSLKSQITNNMKEILRHNEAKNQVMPLFQDSRIFVRVATMHAIATSQSRIHLQIGNSSTENITDLSVTVKDMPQLTLKMNPVANSIDAGSTITTILDIQVSKRTSHLYVIEIM